MQINEDIEDITTAADQLVDKANAKKNIKAKVDKANATPKEGLKFGMAHVLKVQLEFTNELLGTAPVSQQVFEQWLGGKAETETDRLAEVQGYSDNEGAIKKFLNKVRATITNGESSVEKSMSIFHYKDGQLVMLAYQLRGMFKDSAKHLRRAFPDSACGTASSLYQRILGEIVIAPKFITLELPKDTEPGVCIRPVIRDAGNVKPGESATAIKASQTVPAGTKTTFEVICLTKEAKAVALECLRYGAVKGTMGWRNSGKGTYKFEVLEERMAQVF